jgi:hypothetical protein
MIGQGGLMIEVLWSRFRTSGIHHLVKSCTYQVTRSGSYAAQSKVTEVQGQVGDFAINTSNSRIRCNKQREISTKIRKSP